MLNHEHKLKGKVRDLDACSLFLLGKQYLGEMLFSYVIYCVDVTQYKCGDHRTTCSNCFFFSTMWILGMKPWLLGLVQVPLVTKPSCLPGKTQPLKKNWWKKWSLIVETPKFE